MYIHQHKNLFHVLLPPRASSILTFCKVLLCQPSTNLPASEVSFTNGILQDEDVRATVVLLRHDGNVLLACSAGSLLQLQRFTWPMSLIIALRLPPCIMRPRVSISQFRPLRYFCQNLPPNAVMLRNLLTLRPLYSQSSDLILWIDS